MFAFIQSLFVRKGPTPYIFRNLPFCVDGKQMPWTVTGIYENIGSGILEWCYDKQDAENLASKMKLDPKFSEVKVQEYKEDEILQRERLIEWFWSKLVP